jgi:SAM-dependent methyltransferase
MDFESLSTKYVGNVASDYVSERAGGKWLAEHEAVEQLLRHVSDGARTLDVPVGTGRLIPFAKDRGFDAYGLDASPDMLAQAQAYADTIGANIQLRQGDIRNIDFPDDQFDLVTCLRFLNWIDAAGVEQATRELVRVSRDKLLIGIRYLAPFDELGADGRSLARRAMRYVGFPHFRAKRWGLVFHDKSFVDALFEKLKVRIVDSRHVERRMDGTDYVFYVLQKT